VIVPRRSERTAAGGLSIVWADGHVSVFAPKPLRLACRCAHCEDEWTGERRVIAAAIPDDIALLEVRPVGRYGYQLAWSDGHNTGIYTFERLREMCACDACGAKGRP
jgi:prepilin-type processing-associated H-X9-DG protein